MTARTDALDRSRSALPPPRASYLLLDVGGAPSPATVAHV